MNLIFESFSSSTLIVAILMLLFVTSCSESQDVQTVNWVDWSEWDAKEAQADKKGLIWIHSPGCDDCQEMGIETFGHPLIIKYINTHYHAAKLDVNYEGDIITKGETWQFIPSLIQGEQGYHQLSAALLGKKEGEAISYPSVVFLDEKFNSIVPISQKLTAVELELLLAFVAEDHFKKMNIEQFKQVFKSKILE